MKKAGRKDPAVAAGIFAAAIGVALLLHKLVDDSLYVSQVFTLAVAVTALCTRGYACGVIVSLLSVFAVNYLFMYPYYAFTLMLPGYAITFVVMLLVSLIISTLVTRIKRQEEVRRAAEKEKLRADLLRSVSHDIRTPLASISGAASALIENRSLPESEQKELLRSIGDDAEWLIRVTENILSVTKFSGGDEPIRKSEEVLEEIISDTIVKFRRKYPSIRVRVMKPERIIVVSADATLISQVLMNLFENSALHGVSVTEITVWVALEPERVSVTVSDDGNGIPEEKLSAIFEGQPVTTRQSDGRRSMGIGLTVCRSILRAHGGDIEAANRPAGGAEFKFYLPHREEQDVC